MRWKRLTVRVLRFTAVVVVGAVAGAGFGMQPAIAHTALVSSDPAEGATLTAPPGHVVLTFNEPLETRLSRFAVVIDGKPAGQPQARVRGERAIVPVPDDSGVYRVVYRVVGSDGHRIDGEVRFTVTGSARAAGSGSPGRSPGEAAGAESGPAAPDVQRSWWWVLVGLGGVLLAGALAYVLVSGRNRDGDRSDRGGTADESGGDRHSDRHGDRHGE